MRWESSTHALGVWPQALFKPGEGKEPWPRPGMSRLRSLGDICGSERGSDGEAGACAAASGRRGKVAMLRRSGEKGVNFLLRARDRVPPTIGNYPTIRVPVRWVGRGGGAVP